MSLRYTPVLLLLVTSTLTIALLQCPQTASAQNPGPPGINDPGGTVVTLYDAISFSGAQVSYTSVNEVETLNATMRNRMSSITIPKGRAVTMYNGDNLATARQMTLYPGNYYHLWDWHDRVDFIRIIEIPLDHPVVYMFDRADRQQPQLFQGLSYGGHLVESLLCNDCFESAEVRGLIRVGVYDATNYGGNRDLYIDYDGDGAYHVLGNGTRGRVSSLIVEDRHGFVPARIPALSQAATGSDYFARLSYQTAPPSARLCECSADGPHLSQSTLLRYDGNTYDFGSPAFGQSANVTRDVPLRPGLNGVAARFEYSSGDRTRECVPCGYSQAQLALTLNTADLKAPTLNSFTVTADGEVQLTWTKTSDVPDEFITTRILRNGRAYATIPPGENTRTFTDDDFPRPDPYRYRIEIEAFDQTARSEELEITPPAGIIRGNVSTRPGGATGERTPVRDVEVCALLQTDLRPVQDTGAVYCATTDAEGNYTIENIYYGEEATFRIVPSKPGHGFDPDFRTRTLTPLNSADRGDFTDTTSFTVSGRIVQPNGPDSCAVASADILVNGQFLGDKSDANGVFSIVIPQGGRYTFRPRLSDHVFRPAERTLDVDADLDALRFADETTRALSGFVRAGCEEFIGRADVRFSSPDGCLDTVVVTAAQDGSYEVELPARPYRVEVIDIALEDGSDLDAGEVVGFFTPTDIDLDRRRYHTPLYLPPAARTRHPRPTRRKLHHPRGAHPRADPGVHRRDHHLGGGRRLPRRHRDGTRHRRRRRRPRRGGPADQPGPRVLHLPSRRAQHRRPAQKVPHVHGPRGWPRGDPDGRSHRHGRAAPRAHLRHRLARTAAAHPPRPARRRQRELPGPQQ